MDSGEPAATPMCLNIPPVAQPAEKGHCWHSVDALVLDQTSQAVFARRLLGAESTLSAVVLAAGQRRAWTPACLARKASPVFLVRWRVP